jgi:hypothetical protein
MNRKFSAFVANFAVLISLLFVVSSCSSKKIVEDHEAKFKDIEDEFSKVAVISKSTTEPEVSVKIEPKKKLSKVDIAPVLKSKPSLKQKSLSTEKVKLSMKANKTDADLPKRAKVDPFREGESVVLTVKYFSTTAGTLALDVDPFKTVNNKKSYAFALTLKTAGLFSMFYSVNDRAETLVDYNDFIPLTYTANMVESKQVKEVRVFYDRAKSEATHWEKVVKKDTGETKKKITWAISENAQNLISSLFYIRLFDLEPGKSYSFKIADDGKNINFHFDVLRREVLSTEIGDIKTVVVKPTIQLEDRLAATGDIFIWMTDDDRKMIVRIEAKIKVGTLVASLKSLNKGKN